MQASWRAPCCTPAPQSGHRMKPRPKPTSLKASASGEAHMPPRAYVTFIILFVGVWQHGFTTVVQRTCYQAYLSQQAEL